MRRRFLTAEWRHLLMLNYELDPGLLRPFLPAGTELDTHEGRTFASLVAFRFLKTRVLGVPLPFHRNFEELNLRFYVRREAPGEVRRAVVFIREVVPRAAIAMVARAIYNEPYIALPMRSGVEGAPPVVHYAWRQCGTWHSLEARAVGKGIVPTPGSHEEFITGHFWGYTAQRDGGTIEYRVEHDRWLVWPAIDVKVHATLEPLFGAAIAGSLAEPASAFIAAGSPVTVYRPERLVRP